MTKECDFPVLISRELTDKTKPSQRLLPPLSANEGITHPSRIDLGKSGGLDDRESLNLVTSAAL